MTTVLGAAALIQTQRRGVTVHYVNLLGGHVIVAIYLARQIKETETMQIF